MLPLRPDPLPSPVETSAKAHPEDVAWPENQHLFSYNFFYVYTKILAVQNGPTSTNVLRATVPFEILVKFHSRRIQKSLQKMLGKNKVGSIDDSFLGPNSSQREKDQMSQVKSSQQKFHFTSHEQREVGFGTQLHVPR